VAFDMWPAAHACRCRRAAKSSRWALRSERQAHAPADRRGLDGHANMNLPRAAAWAARRGGRVPKTEPPTERCLAMPALGARETDDFVLPFSLAIRTSSASRSRRHGAIEAVKPSSPTSVGGQKLNPVFGAIVV